MHKAARNRKETNQPLSLRIGDKLRKELREAKETTGLSESDLARLAMERGLPLLIARLAQPDEVPA